MSQVRKFVTGWLEQYLQRSSSPEEIEALHELLERMTDSQLGKFLEWLAARGELDDGWSVSLVMMRRVPRAGDPSVGSVGWGLPRFPKRGRKEPGTAVVDCLLCGFPFSQIGSLAKAAGDRIPHL